MTILFALEFPDTLYFDLFICLQKYFFESHF